MRGERVLHRLGRKHERAHHAVREPLRILGCGKICLLAGGYKLFEQNRNAPAVVRLPAPFVAVQPDKLEHRVARVSLVSLRKPELRARICDQTVDCIADLSHDLTSKQYVPRIYDKKAIMLPPSCQTILGE